MTKRMLIDATHDEETRVAVVDGNRLEEFDYESKFRKPLKGSIFLAKVTRVEPSLQAAFVNFGGNRHGFLPFSEIHPDYFRIPIADREALIAEQEAMMAQDEEEEEEEEKEEEAENNNEKEAEDNNNQEDIVEELDDEDNIGNTIEDDTENDADGNRPEIDPEGNDENARNNKRRRYPPRGGRGGRNSRGGRGGNRRAAHNNRRTEAYGEDVEGGKNRSRFNLRRKYKIQEVIKRGQIMLVQVS